MRTIKIITLPQSTRVSIDSETLWNHALAVTSDNDVTENNLGIIFLGRGQVDKAISRFQTAVDLRPENAPAHDNLARLFFKRVKWRRDVALS